MTEDLKGQVAIVRTSGFWPFVIRLITHSHYNHMVVGLGEGMCIGAEPGGARVYPVAQFDDICWSHFELEEWQRRAIAGWARAREGAPYSYLDDLLIGVAILTGTHTPHWLHRRLESMGHWQCAALADAALAHAGIHVFADGRPFGAVYPGTFQKYFRSRGWLPPALQR